MTFVVCCTGLSDNAEASDVRAFFVGLDIPPGGVHIIGGSLGHVYVSFTSKSSMDSALARDGRLLCGEVLQLSRSSEEEMNGHMERVANEETVDESRDSDTTYHIRAYEGSQSRHNIYNEGQTPEHQGGTVEGQGGNLNSTAFSTADFDRIAAIQQSHLHKYPPPTQSSTNRPAEVQSTSSYAQPLSQSASSYVPPSSQSASSYAPPPLSQSALSYAPPTSQSALSYVPPPTSQSSSVYQLRHRHDVKPICDGMDRVDLLNAQNKQRPQSQYQTEQQKPQSQYQTEQQKPQSQYQTEQQRPHMQQLSNAHIVRNPSPGQMPIQNQWEIDDQEQPDVTRPPPRFPSPAVAQLTPPPMPPQIVQPSAMPYNQVQQLQQREQVPQQQQQRGSQQLQASQPQQMPQQLQHQAPQQTQQQRQAPRPQQVVQPFVAMVHPTTYAQAMSQPPPMQLSPSLCTPQPVVQQPPPTFYSNPPMTGAPPSGGGVARKDMKDAPSTASSRTQRSKGLLSAPSMPPCDRSKMFDHAVVAPPMDAVPVNESILARLNSVAFDLSKTSGSSNANGPLSMLQRYRYFKLSNMPPRLSKFHSVEAFVQPMQLPNRHSVIFYRLDHNNPITDICILRLDNSEDCDGMFALQGMEGVAVNESSRLEYEQAAALYDPGALTKDCEPASIPCDKRVAAALSSKGDSMQQYQNKNFLMLDNIAYRATGANIAPWLAKHGIAMPRSFKMVPSKDDLRYSGTWLVECADREAYEKTLTYGRTMQKLMDRTVYIRQIPNDPVWPPPQDRGGGRGGGGRDRDMRQRRRDRDDRRGGGRQARIMSPDRSRRSGGRAMSPIRPSRKHRERSRSPVTVKKETNS